LEQLIEERPAITHSDPTPASAKASKGMPKNTRPAIGLGLFTAPQPPIPERPGTSRAPAGRNARQRRPSLSGASSTSSRGGERGERKRRRSETETPVTTISDEADSLKKIRRQTHYRECSRHFIRYFTDAGIIPRHTIGISDYRVTGEWIRVTVRVR